MKISLIVPVYNASESLPRCLDSMLAQTFRDFEVLLIDDGSSDDSGAVCDRYVELDNRIRVFHKENGGVSAARQLGIDNARGEYTIHADADDWVEPTMLEELYNKAVDTDADVVICDFYVNKDDRQTYVKQQPIALDHITILRSLFQQLHGSCWNKLVKRACYKEYNIKFPVGINHCEDLLTWIQIYQHPVKTAYLPEAFYHYVQNDESITHHFTRKTYEMRQSFYNEVCKVLPVDGYGQEKRRTRLNVLTEGYMFGVVPNKEAWKELISHNKRAAFCETKSLRWLAGYGCLAVGLFPIAKRLLSYD